MSLAVDPLESKQRIPVSLDDQAQAKILSTAGQPDYLAKPNAVQRAAVEPGIASEDEADRHAVR